MRDMKDSGVEWIGEIPIDWEVSKIKFVAKSNLYTLSEDTAATQMIDYIDIGSVTYTNGIELVQRFSFDEAPSRARRIVHTGDTIISTVRTYLKAVAYIENKYDSFVVSTGFSVLTPNQGLNTKYLYYAISSHSFISEVESNSVGISYPAINDSVLIDLKSVFPTLKTQLRIADHLDAKCAQIDRAIARQQEVIEKLKEYKLSVITEAVTKGLNPDVPMKDSGIDICSLVPNTWNILKIKHLFSLRVERNYESLEDINLLSLYTDLGVFPHGEQEERGNKAVTADGYKIVAKNDIVVNIILAWMGAIGISEHDGVTSPAYDIYMPLKGTISKYYHYLFRTKAFSAECYKNGRGIMEMRWRTYSTEFMNIFVPVPPEEDQINIADYLDKKCSDIDAVILGKESAVNKLTEYKKSLIYEVVTGKREV